MAIKLADLIRSTVSFCSSSSLSGHPHGAHFLPYSEGAFKGNKESFEAELELPTTYYLVDGQLPEPARARRIETCSPMHAKQWVRSSVVHLHPVTLYLACKPNQE